MSTLTNNANNSSSNSNSNNNNNSSSNNTNNNNNSIASYYQQYIQHYQLSPQGGTAPPSAGGSPTVTSINNNNNNNNGPTSDNIHTINNNNNNISTSSSSTSSNQSQPTTAANSGSGGGGGVVGGILGVREVSAKLFLPFARAKMMHSSSSAASTPAKDQHQPGTPLDGTSMAGMNATPSGTPSATPGTTTGGSSAGVSGAGRASSLIIPKALNVVLHGYHRKHKTNKKKYFVVYGDVPGKAARLEYFDSEKKFKQSFQKGSAGCDGGTQPKRTIVLRTCFNINKRHDLKKQIISLYTKDDSFCIVFESEEELNLWLRTLLRLQRGEDSEGDPPRPTFEHVWEVYVQRKGLGDSYGILGNYRLCITDKTLSLVRIGSELTPHQEKRAENVEFLLASVRRCGHSQRYFYLEVGRSSKTGAGEIWMEVQDSIIAQNMYTTIMKSAKSKDDNLGPMIRIRSSSANAASKPTSMLFRRQTHTGQKPINCSPSSVSSGLSAVANMSSPAAMGNSTTAAMMMLPPSPSASMSKFHHYASTRQGGKEVPGSGGGITLSNLLATITHSLVGVGGGGAGSGAANGDSGPLATASGGSGGSGGSSSGGSFSNFSTSSRSSSRCSSTVSIQTVATVPLMGPPPPPPPPPPLEGAPALCGVRRRHTRSLSHHSANAIYLTGAKPLRRLRSTLRRHSVSGVAIARERCDSLPSRNRTTSETMPHQQQQQQQHLLNQQQQQQHHHQLMLNSGSMPPPRMIPSSNRPHSVHISHSHSPPVNSSPLSPPPPATYSTGSDGSSLSIDESTDSFITGSLTPDEGQGYPKVINQLNSGCSIPEENSEEFIKDYGHIDLSAAGCGISQHDDFAVPTHHTAAPTSNATPILAGSSSSSAVGRVGHPHHNSLSLPISQAARRGGSPAPPSTVGSVEGSAYMEMCSPSGSSPGDPSGSCYMAMSPVADFSRGLCSSSSAHSRASSLAEDIVDGYVPMSMPRTAAAAPAAPPTEEYMLMDPTLNGGGTSSRLSNATAASNNAGSSIIGGGGMSSAASSCSITSGTPSADLRLSLEKVPAYIGQSDEHEVNDRPFRTYSVGSRPELIKRKLRVEMLSSGESSVGGSSAGGSASSRQRAFSVGSRAKVPRCSDVYKGYSAAPVIVSFASTSSQGSMLESSNNNSSSSTSSISHAGSYGASIGDTLPMDELAGGGSAGGSSMGRKSGSGSLLPDGAGGGKPPSHGGSHGRMSDLMEIDYSSPRQQPARPSTRSSEPSGMEDYLDMSGNNNEEEQRARGQGATSSGYVEMRPGRLNSQSEENDYLNMTPGGGGRDEPDCCPAAASIATSSPIQIQHHAKQPADGAGSAHSSSSNNNNNNYLEMYPRAAVAQKEQKRTASAASTTTTATKVPSEDYLNMAPLMISSLGEASGSEEEKMHGPDEEPLLESSSAPPDGYMEMSWNHHGPVTAAGPVSSSASSSATSSARTVPTNGGDDYMNMSCGSGSQSEDASRTYSAPITIQPGAGKCRLDLSGESKVEAGANIPNYLPLGQHPDARKSVHHPHHQSAMIVALQQHLPLAAQAPIQTTTGQQSGSIGFSPSKPAETTPERARCDSRDSGIVTPSGSQPTIFPFSPASPTKPFAPAQDEPMGGESLDDLSQNYAELSLGRQQQQQLQQAQTELSPAIRKLSTGSNRGSGSFSKLQLVANQPDYVNYCPATPPISGDVAPPASIMPLNVLPSAQSRTRSSIDDDGAGDYALMNPASSRKLSTTSMGSMGGASLSPAGVVPPGSSAVGSITPPVLVARKSTLLLSSPQMGFKPIASSQDAELLLQSKAVPHATANSPKALNLGRRTGEPAFSFTEQQHQQQQMAPLQRSISTGTRPNSVNSELIGRPIGTPAGPSTPGAASHSSTTAAGSTRPSSANSERLPVISATSSSASSTSTLCESKNQSPSASSTALAMVVGSSTTTSPPSVPGSRPDSVSSITDPHIVSRPPSVSSERELHYASLDLPPCSSSSSGKQTVAASPFAPGTMMLLAAAAAATTPAATSSAAAPVTKMDVDEPLPGSNEARTSIDSSSPSPTTAAGLQQQQQPVRCAAFTYAQIDFVRSQAQSQQGQTGTGPAGASGQSTTTTTTSTPPQSSQA
ncbi:pneumococcal serine-rich repeat protein isoform X5 [Anopheles gambiae]|uniref:pneumococcal serine-rich repeat protein isoform X5 n=1 Tax=Anopheles gambiae TaxID=7165 RepID=UPI002AC9916F|nr:pneumococcal serine-rich repeat protein isoform X5 [Anopheles gambiae]